MQLNDWDLEFQKIIKGVEVLSKNILYTDHKLKSILIKKSLFSSKSKERQYGFLQKMIH